MKWLMMSFVLGACVLSDPAAAGARRERDETHGVIRMEKDGTLRVVYDDNPDLTLTTPPGDYGYPFLLELAGSLRPGQSKRLRKGFMDYDVTPEGAYILHGWARAPGAQSEPGQIFVGRSDPRYSCFRTVLRRSTGKHQMLSSEYEKIGHCRASG